MKPSAFDYIRVDTLEETFAILADSSFDAKILAGGQSLLPLLNMRLARPGALVDVNGLSGLDALELRSDDEGAQLAVGALVRQRTLERYALAEPSARLLYAALTNIGHPQTRNQGTVGGSLAHADPSAELPLVFTTLGGTAVVQNARGQRQVAAEEFFQGHFTTAIEPDEMLIRTVWRLPARHAGIAFREFRRRHGDFALVAAACVLEVDGRHTIQKVRLGIGGVADTPQLVKEAQELVSEPWTVAHARAIVEKVARQLDLADDIQASASYRRQLAAVSLFQVLEGAFKDALAKEATHAADQG
ncbi:MAG: FAD binding domain-containing protein [Chloroflexi bacterium]|nr:FAD binding domain-containing protein [Chloroflexota bacterium]